MSSLDKRPQLQRGGIHGKTEITLRLHPGDMALQSRKSHSIQEQTREDGGSHHCDVADLEHKASRTGIHEHSHQCGIGDKQSGGRFST